VEEVAKGIVWIAVSATSFFVPALATAVRASRRTWLHFGTWQSWSVSISGFCMKWRRSTRSNPSLLSEGAVGAVDLRGKKIGYWPGVQRGTDDIRESRQLKLCRSF